MAQSYTTNIEMRFSDLDAYGHVNSVVYFAYLETARLKAFSKPFWEAADAGIFLVVARCDCTFKMPIFYGDEVQVSLSIPKVGGSSFEIEYRIHDRKDKTYATASTTMVCFDNVKKTTVPVPESIKTLA